MLFANFLKKDLMNNSNEKIEEVFKGIAASPGIVFGEVYFFTKHTPRIEEKNISSQNIENEITKFEHAIKRSEVELLKIQTLTEQKIGKSNANIFEAQILILNDAILFKTICELIKRTKKMLSILLIWKSQNISNSCFPLPTNICASELTMLKM